MLVKVRSYLPIIMFIVHPVNVSPNFRGNICNECEQRSNAASRYRVYGLLNPQLHDIYTNYKITM